MVGDVLGRQDNFCRPLEDYGPRTETMEERHVCQTSFEKECKQVTVADCMEVTELSCQVNLFTNCSMDWQLKGGLESLMAVSLISIVFGKILKALCYVIISSTFKLRTYLCFR